MLKIKNKIGLLLLVGVLTSCGYGLREVYNGDAYNSPIFSENYYRIYNSEIDPANPNNKINSTENIRLDKNSDAVALTYKTAKMLSLDSDMSFLEYVDYYSKDDPESIGKRYGPTKKMSRVDSSFSYGYVSKLFDGQMFCNGYYERARVQVDENGFGTIFQKEIVDQGNGYFALNFKGAANSKSGSTTIKGHMSQIDLHISFFLRDGSGFKKTTVSYVIDEVPVRYNESYDNKYGYVFFAFKLDRIDVERCAGISISYDLLADVDDEGNDYKNNTDIEHALLLYEMMMPYCTWR